MRTGELQLIPYIMEDNQDAEAVIITDVGATELAVGGKKSVSVPRSASATEQCTDVTVSDSTATSNEESRVKRGAEFDWD